jgi:hypothetical protein
MWTCMNNILEILFEEMVYFTPKYPFPQIIFMHNFSMLLIHTHYMHSVVVHYFVSDRVCCVNKYVERL